MRPLAQPTCPGGLSIEHYSAPRLGLYRPRAVVTSRKYGSTSRVAPARRFGWTTKLKVQAALLMTRVESRSSSFIGFRGLKAQAQPVAKTVQCGEPSYKSDLASTNDGVGQFHSRTSTGSGPHRMLIHRICVYDGPLNRCIRFYRSVWPPVFAVRMKSQRSTSRRKRGSSRRPSHLGSSAARKTRWTSRTS